MYGPPFQIFIHITFLNHVSHYIIEGASVLVVPLQLQNCCFSSSFHLSKALKPKLSTDLCVAMSEWWWTKRQAENTFLKICPTFF